MNLIIVNCRKLRTFYAIDLNKNSFKSLNYTHKKAHLMIFIGRYDGIFIERRIISKKLQYHYF
jgi:hypothetical protein